MLLKVSGIEDELMLILIRHGQYWQIAYQKFLFAQNCIKKI